MAEYSELETLKANGCDSGNTIRTHFAEIIVRCIADKPYYEILYFDTEDRSYHIGFGSYCLEYVFKWLSEEFEIVDDWQTADIAPVRHGKWLEWFPEDCALIMTGEEMLYQCSSCDAKYYDTEGYKYCPNCGCRMDGGDDE